MAKKQISKFKKNKLFLTVSPVVVFLIIVLFIHAPFYKKVYPNIYVSNIYLGDKNKSEAISYFKDNYKIPEKLNLIINDSKKEISTSEIVIKVDNEATIERAYNYANSGNYLLDTITKLKLIFKPQSISPIVIFDEDKLLELILISSNTAGKKPVYPSATKVNGEIIVNPGSDGIEVDIQKTRQDIGNALLNGKGNQVTLSFKSLKVKLNADETKKYKDSVTKLINSKIELKSDFDLISIPEETLFSFISPNGYSENKIKDEILKVSRQINRGPQDSVFIVENGTVSEFTPSKDGITVNEDVLSDLIKKAIEEISKSDKKTVQIDIPSIKVAPKIKNSDVNNLGINTLLGKGFSNFKGSIPNRIHNVNLAQSKFKGLLVPPNEVVSFNDVLGDVSAFTGYKSAYVIMDGKTVLGDGGGVCQVSTTLFRAVLSAGLPVVERRAHAYRVGYYEQGFGPGLDATVYSPTTDFKFKNDTEKYILIQPTIDLNNLSLTFEIYGTSDGRVSTVSKPVITSSSAPAEDLYVDDPTLPLGTIKQIEHRAYGAKVVFDYKVTRNGEEIINKKFVSNYRPWQAVYLRGTAQ